RISNSQRYRGHRLRSFRPRLVKNPIIGITGCCARCERPRDRGAAEKRDQPAPFQLIELHSIPAS
ncbi:MAG: hypothetical protein ACREXY_12440, partial [Gammaproteobacteria bacterium]